MIRSPLAGRAVLILALLCAALAVPTLHATPAGAAPGFVVDDAGDAVDAAIDGVCATATATCTLRAAVQEADAAAGTTDISFAPAADTVGLSLSGSGGADVGDLDITSGATVRLLGNVVVPNQVTTVKAAALGDRLAHVHAGGRLELVDVTLAGGSTTGDGGGILNEGEVLISNTTSSEGSYQALSGNSAGGQGGAVANYPGASLWISNVSTSTNGSRIDVSGNSAVGGGGAVANLGGTVALTGTTPPGQNHDVYVDSNTSPADGGGVLNAKGSLLTLGCRGYVRFSTADRGGDVYNAGDLVMSGGVVDAGSANVGGGLFNDTTGAVSVKPDATCQMSAGAATRSTAVGDGGGILNRGDITVAAMSQLQVLGDGNQTDAVRGGGLFQEQGQVTVDGQLWVADSRASLAGGGIAIVGGIVSTGAEGNLLVQRNASAGDGAGAWISQGLLTGLARFDGNKAAGTGGGIASSGPAANVSLQDSALLSNSAGSGGGIGVDAGTVILWNTTIGGNSATSAGGGVWSAGGSTTLRHVTVADNIPDGIASSGSRPTLQRVLVARHGGKDCAGTGVVAGDFNVFDDASCGPTGTDLTDSSRFADVAAFLEATIAVTGTDASYDLLAGQPAIDWVNDAGCGTPGDDQNGRGRPANGDVATPGAQCDAGAVEAPYGGPLRRLSGVVRSEVDGAPLLGVCVFAGQINGNDDGQVGVTDADGAYSLDVPEGQFLMAFFKPLGGALTPKDCDGNKIDKSIQPEWYRNVPVQFKPAPDDQQVIFPDLNSVTTVTVAGADVSSLDACLGAGPTAGLDAPCAPRADAAPPADAVTPPVSSAPTDPALLASAGSGSSGSTGAAAAGRSSATPKRLASTGGDAGTLLPWGLALIATGGGLAWCDRRRRRLLGA